MNAADRSGTDWSVTDWSGMARAEAEIRAVSNEYTDLLSVDRAGCSHQERAEIDGRLAVLSAREAAWWRVLADRTPIEVPFVYRSAAILAHVQLHERAREYRDRATSWRDLAARRAARLTARDQVAEPGSAGEPCGVTR